MTDLFAHVARTGRVHEFWAAILPFVRDDAELTRDVAKLLTEAMQAEMVQQAQALPPDRETLAEMLGKVTRLRQPVRDLTPAVGASLHSCNPMPRPVVTEQYTPPEQNPPQS